MCKIRLDFNKQLGGALICSDKYFEYHGPFSLLSDSCGNVCIIHDIGLLHINTAFS